jgi:hypothetical protein
MGLRASINNLILTDRPESPTDVVFIFGSMIMIALWIFATLTKGIVPHIEIVVAFLTGCKAVKMAGKFAGPVAPPGQPPPAT